MTNKELQTALDLLHKGGCSPYMLGGELVRRGLIARHTTIQQTYAYARSILDDLAASGKARKWPSGECYTIPDKTTIEPKKEPK